jgi:hypothetical protein
VSLLFNEDAAWLVQWVEFTHAALGVKHHVVVSTGPEYVDKLRNATYLDERVHFSAPAVKSKLGLNLLRGHVANLKYAFGTLSFSHAVLVTSNTMWIRKVTADWVGWRTPDRPGTAPMCLPTEEARADTGPMWWWYPALRTDPVLWNFLDRERVQLLCKCAHEGLVATRGAWRSVLAFLALDAELLLHDAPDKQYPAEEVYFATAIMHLEIFDSVLQTVAYNLDVVTVANISAARNSSELTILYKRVPRVVDDPVVLACREGQY